MSVKHHESLTEDLEVWLHDNKLWFYDIKIDSRGFYFVSETGERIEVPRELQDICQITKNNLQKKTS